MAPFIHTASFLECALLSRIQSIPHIDVLLSEKMNVETRVIHTYWVMTLTILTRGSEGGFLDITCIFALTTLRFNEKPRM